MKRKTKIRVGVGIALFAVLLFGLMARARRGRAVIVDTTKVERKARLEATVSASGEIASKNFVDIQAEIAGVITALFVREGDRVEKGDMLLKIDATQNLADLKAAQAQLEGARFDVQFQTLQLELAKAGLKRDEAALSLAKLERKQAESAFEQARRNFGRRKTLYEEGLLSEEALDAARLELEQREAQFASAKARLVQAETQVELSRLSIAQNAMMQKNALTRVASAEANLMRARDRLTKTTLLSPIAGTIVQLNVEAGERAVPGTINAPQATLMRIADNSAFQAEIEVGETDVVRIRVGNPARVTLDAFPYDPMTGVVSEIGNSPIGLSTTGRLSQQDAAREFKVVVSLDDPKVPLKPGLSATAEITTDVRENVLVIPMQALTIREVPVDEGGNYVPPEAREAGRSYERKERQGVFLYADGGIARFVPVETGIVGETETEVLSGLEEGMVIVSGSYKTLRTLEEGARIRTRPTGRKP